MNKRWVAPMTLLLFSLVVFTTIMMRQDRLTLAWSESDRAAVQARGGDYALSSMLIFSDVDEAPGAVISPGYPILR